MSKMSFSDFLFQAFLDWEKRQPTRRSSYRKFAEWLSDNSLQIEISHSLVGKWINKSLLPSDKYHFVLVEKLGPEVAEVLGIQPPDPNLVAISKLWKHLNDDQRLALRRRAEQFAHQGASNEQEQPEPSPANT